MLRMMRAVVAQVNDVFTASIGNLAPGGAVQIESTYVPLGGGSWMELAEKESI
jgi:hypothetical protein